MSLVEHSVRQISDMFKNRKITAMEILDEFLNIALKGSCITFCNKLSFESAKRLDKINIFSDDLSPIAALPFSLKDNICTEGILTTCNSRSLKMYTPDYNADIAQRLLDLGGVLTAKNCMREFSVGRIEDSAFELRNYLVWAGTSANTNIGAYAIGTDIGLCESFFGTWMLKLVGLNANGVITGSPTLEKLTLMARRADDLNFLTPYLYEEYKEQENKPIIPNQLSVLVFDNNKMGGYLADFFQNAGFKTSISDCAFLEESDLIYEVILCTDFFMKLRDIGTPEQSSKKSNEEHIANRSEGIGFEAKLNIIKGAHLLSEKNKENTLDIVSSAANLLLKMYSFLDKYDFIAAPAVYGDRLSKAAAVVGLAELTVPYADALSFKLVSKPEKQQFLLDMALFLEERI